MATVNKTWDFAADNQGLADAGVGSIVVQHDTGGNPGGSLEFVGGATGTTERAVKATTGETWETWLVPAGAIVTDVQITAIDYRVWANPNARTITLGARVVGSGGSTVHTAGDLLAQAMSGAAWNTVSGPSRAVDAGSQPSNTDVRLELQYTTNVADGNVDVGVDNITLTITYTPAAGGAAPKTVVVTVPAGSGWW